MAEDQENQYSAFNLEGYAYYDFSRSAGIYPYKEKNTGHALGLIGSLDQGTHSLKFQVESREEGGLSDGQPRLIYGFLDIKAEDRYGVRLGRVQYQNGFGNRVRNIPDIAQWINNPPAMGREQFKYVMLSGDGIQLYGNHSSDSGYTTDLEVSYTRPIFYPGREAEYLMFGDPNIASFEAKKSVFKSYNLTLANPTREHVFRYDYTDFDFYAKSHVLGNGTAGSIIQTLSYRYFHGNHIFTGQALRASVYGSLWNNYNQIFGNNGDGVGYEFSYIWKPDSRREYSVYVDYYCAQSKDCNGQKTEVNTGVPAHQFYSRSRGVSVKYRLTSEFTIQTQFSQGVGTAANSYSNMVGDSLGDKNWRLLQLRLIYSWK